MQYLLKITVLGLPEAVWRMISVEGKADLAHTMALCNLAFDYANYADSTFYLPHKPELMRALACLRERDLHAYCAPLMAPEADFWTGLITRSAEFEGYGAEAAPSAVTALETVLEPLRTDFERTIAPHFAPEGYELKPTFLYEVHGVQHLVEVMRAETKLACFVPATLMGAVALSAHDLQGADELSYDLLQRKLAAAEAAYEQRAVEVERKQAAGEGIDPNWEHEFSLNLKECTSRLRALGAMRSQQSINQSVLQAGGAALKVKSL